MVLMATRQVVLVSIWVLARVEQLRTKCSPIRLFEVLISTFSKTN